MGENFDLELQGTIKRDGNNLRVYTSHDFIEYYKWLIQRHLWIECNTPMHSSHLTIVNEKIHGRLDHTLLDQWHGSKISIKYSPFIHVGGQTKNYRIFMLRCQCPVLDYIADDLGVTKPWHWHFTVCNYAKTSNKQIYFPKIITI